MIPWEAKDKLIIFLECRSWEVLSGALSGDHKPASILGVLCRKLYPGFVTLPDGRREPAYTWER